MSLTVNIAATDDFQKAALAASRALDEIADKEKHITAIAKQLGVAQKDAARAVAQVAKNEQQAIKLSEWFNAEAEKERKLQESKKMKAEKNAAKAQKEASQREKEKNETMKKGLAIVGGFAASLAASAVAAAALGYKIADAGKAAFDSKRESVAMLNAWTGQRGPQALKLIDGLASQIGMRFEDARSKFVEFRQAGLDNRLSFKLLKMRADLMAVGLSAETADKQIAMVTAVGHDPAARARAINMIERAFKGVGTGALAASYALTSVEGAQNKLSNVVNEKMADLWGKIGPSIGKAANRLADFAIKMIESDEGKAAIEGIAKAFTLVADAVTSENLTTGLNVVKAFAVAIGDVFDYAGKAIAIAAVAVANASEWIMDKVASAVDYLVDSFPDGASLIDGFIDGIKSRASQAVESVIDVAKNIAEGFAETLGIHSPSKLFADYGRNTVAGFQQGQEQALPSSGMPLESAASVAPKSSSVAPAGITIENLIVHGGGNADGIARAVRQELQLLLSAGALSRGYA